MSQGFFSLDEAAQALGLTPDDLNRMAQRREIRAFADRGAWRFRVQDVEDLSRKRGGGDPGKSHVNPLRPKSEMKPAPAPTPAARPTEMELFNYDLSDADIPSVPPPLPEDELTAAGFQSAAKDLKAGSEGDVHLVLDDNDGSEFELSTESSGRLGPPVKPPVDGSEFELSSEDSGRLAPPPPRKPTTLPEQPSKTAVKPEDARDDEVMLDFETASTLDDSMVSILSQPESEAPKDAPPRASTMLRPPTGIGSSSELVMEPEGTQEIDLDVPPPGDASASQSKTKTRFLPQTPGGTALQAEGGLPTQIGSKQPGASTQVAAPGASKLAPAGKSKVAPAGPGSSSKLAGASSSKLAPGSSSKLGGATKAVAGKTALPPLPGGQTVIPSSSPFELSDADLDAGGPGPSQSPTDPSEFELTLAPDVEASPLSLGDDEDIDLGGGLLSGSASGRAELSGINLSDPADSGISLEKGAPSAGGSAGGDIDFELTLDEGSSASMSRKTAVTPQADSSDFELTLDETGALSAGAVGSIGSSDDQRKAFETDFDLPSMEASQVVSLDEDDSASEAIELDDIRKGAAASGATLNPASTSGTKDIFETDFDLPALEEDAGLQPESGSDAVPLEELDTDLESSDFDLSMDELASSVSLPAGHDESGSVVVALDDESSNKTDLDSESLSEVEELLTEDELEEVDEDEDEEDEEIAPAPTVAAAQAEWGVFPIIMMLPCVLVMFVAGLMAYELVRGMWGYKPTSKPTGQLVSFISDQLTGDKSKE